MIKTIIHKEDKSGNVLTLLEDLHVTWCGKALTIPAGFESDGCSVPRILWGFLSPNIDPRTIRAAITHDYIYRNTPVGWTRLEADELFYDFMVEDGFAEFKAGTAYYGVRIFGGSSWQS